MSVPVSEKRIPGFCALCKSRCGSILVTRDGRFVGQEPNPDHPTGQALCIKGKAAAEIVYNSQRQLYPLRRTRPKGSPDPGWERVSWAEALGKIASEIGTIRAQTGAESVAFGWTTPSGTPISDNMHWLERFANAFGSPNIAAGTEICNWHKDNAHAYTFGRSIASPDFENTGCVVLWGHNPSATWLDHATATASARTRGAKLVVVDPRQIGFASRADQWLRVRPGSDGALALGIAGEMIRNGWFDKDFVDQWTNGPFLVRADNNRFVRSGDLASPPSNSSPGDLVAWSQERGGVLAYCVEEKEFRAPGPVTLEAALDLVSVDGVLIRCKSAFRLFRELCEQFTPARAEEICWVPGSQVTETARLLFESRPICYYGWSGLGQHTNATQTDRAIAILMALTGCFDAPGGNVVFSRPAARNVSGSELLSSRQREKCVGWGRSILGPARDGYIGSDQLYDAVLDGNPYQIRALVNFGRNFIVTHADGDRAAKALAKLEFHVQSDLVMTPTANYADIFLPINTPWEREALRVGFDGGQAAQNLVQLRQAAIPSLGETRSDGQIVFDLAVRLGFGDAFWNGDIVAGTNAILEPLGLTRADLLERPGGITMEGQPAYYAYRERGFQTATGKIEIFSEVFRDAGQDPLPGYVEPARSPFDTRQDGYPLVLTSAKVVHFCHGQHRNIASLRKRSPEPEIGMHPATAFERAIAEGDWVEIHTAKGKARMRAKFDGSLDPRVVSAQYGWWQANDTLGLRSYDAASDLGANYNRLISEEADPISGSTGLRSSMCEVVAIKAAERAWMGWRDFDIAPLAMETHDILSFSLKPADGGKLPPIRAGQHIVLRVPQDNGPAIVRCYTVSRPTDGTHYRISVKRSGRDDGPVSMSKRLHALRSTGPCQVQVQAPKGDFHLASLIDEGSALVLLAGGIGITPILAMLHDLAGKDWQGPIHLFYGVRSGADFAFRDELMALGGKLANFKRHLFYSMPSDKDLGAREYDGLGHFSASDVMEVVDAGSQVFLCGPPGMIDALVRGLDEAGLGAGRVRLEAFGPSSRQSKPTDAGPQPVRLAVSDVNLLWAPEAGTLLELMEKAGVKAASGCRSGQCQSCMVKLVEGAVAHPDDVGAMEQGYCLPCVCIPLSPITVEI